MFNIQPGTGLGFTGSREIALSLGGTVVLDIEIGPQPGGGSKKSRRQLPGITSNRAIAIREDEEVLAMLEAYFNKTRH